VGRVARRVAFADVSGVGRCRCGAGIEAERLGQKGLQLLQQAFAAGDLGGVERLPGFGHIVDQRGHVIGTRQHDADQRLADRDRVCAQALQYVFHHVREGDHCIEAEQARRTLDGMRRAKQRIDHLLVGRCAFQAQQGRFHFMQQAAALGDIGL